eukprot:7376797-Prymnesium_polylepis.1
MLHSVFCFCPSGTGWGMRVFHAAALGCVPVIMQQDEDKRYPPVLQAFEGLLLDWDQFSVLLDQSALPRLPDILRGLAANATAITAKRQALAAMWTRLLWRQSLTADVALTLRNVPDAFDSGQTRRTASRGPIAGESRAVSDATGRRHSAGTCNCNAPLLLKVPTYS